MSASDPWVPPPSRDGWSPEVIENNPVERPCRWCRLRGALIGFGHAWVATGAVLFPGMFVAHWGVTGRWSLPDHMPIFPDAIGTMLLVGIPTVVVLRRWLHSGLADSIQSWLETKLLPACCRHTGVKTVF
jgi:hypothetical protein